MTRQLSQSDGNVFESSISQTNKPSKSIISVFNISNEANG